MFRRFLLGLIEGLLVGLVLAVPVVRGFGLATPGALLAALLAAVVGFLVGLIAGRPVWAPTAKIEALLKAGAGAVVAALLSLTARRFLHAPVDLSEFALGEGPVGELTAVSLPAIACALALFFELDDSSGTSPPARSLKARVHSAPEELTRQNQASELDEAAAPGNRSPRTLEKR